MSHNEPNPSPRRTANRPYIGIKPLQRRERQVGPFLFEVESYRGFLAEPHAHAEQQVTVPLKGRMHLKVENLNQIIGPEGAILLPAEVPHSVTYLDGELEFLCITAPAGWIETLVGSLGLAPPAMGKPLIISEPFLWPLARHMAAEVNDPKLGSNRQLLLGLEQIAISLARSAQIPSGTDKKQDPRILRAVDYLMRHYSEDLKLEDIAKDLAMTSRHFERCFKEALGNSPKRFLINVRLSIAIELLETTDWSITHMGQEVGFSHSSHFIDSFKKANGSTPAAYRQSQRLSGNDSQSEI